MAIDSMVNHSFHPHGWILVDSQGGCQAIGLQACRWLELSSEKAVGVPVVHLLGFDEVSREVPALDALTTVYLPAIDCRAELHREILPHGMMLWLEPQRLSAGRTPLYRTVFERAAAGLARLALDGRFIEANTEFCRLVGYSRDAIGDLNFNDLIVGRGEWEQGSDLEKLLTSGENALSCQRLCLRQDGSEVWTHLNISLVRECGEVSGCFVLVLRDISELKKAENDAQFLALYDSLTGLPNRRMLEDRVRQALIQAERDGCQVAVLFLDLDRFKQVNDVLGHHSGDKLLVEVGERLRHCVRRVDTVARLGGDEFVVVLQSLADGTLAKITAEKILAAMAEPFLIDARQVYSGASIGISRYPEDGVDAETLLKHADAAMYLAKEQGRGGFRFFSAEINRAVAEKVMLENGMRLALQSGQFFLEYQPRVDLQRGEMVGVEALLRWEHPELGTLLPGRFIRLAEESGLIAPLGRWVLMEACRQVAAWHVQGMGSLGLTVNVSGRQFRIGDVAEEVARALEESGLPASCLELELSEGTLMDRSPEMLEALLDLRVLGVRLAIDDFGAGYSSLSYLQEFSVDAIKIDRSFIQHFKGAGDRAPIAEAIISMAHNLGIRASGKGVETEAQRYFLLSRGCDEGQGYLFAPPLHPRKLEEAFRRMQRLGLPAMRIPSALFQQEVQDISRPASQGTDPALHL